MNNRNWVAVFLGLACLVLFVGVMGVSGNWTSNNSRKNNGVTPQQVNQTVKGMNTRPNGNTLSQIDASSVISQVSGDMQNIGSNISNMSMHQ